MKYKRLIQDKSNRLELKKDELKKKVIFLLNRFFFNFRFFG